MSLDDEILTSIKQVMCCLYARLPWTLSVDYFSYRENISLDKNLEKGVILIMSNFQESCYDVAVIGAGMIGSAAAKYVASKVREWIRLLV